MAFASLVACGDDTATSGSESGAATSSSTGAGFSTSSGQPTGQPTGDVTTGDVTGDTTGEPAPEVIRVVYQRFDDPPHQIALRGVKIVDGVPQPPFDVLTPPEGSWLQIPFTLDLPRWIPVTAGGADPSHFWIVDTATLEPHEIPVPPGRAFETPRFNSDESAVILRAAAGTEQPPFVVCAIGEDVTCPLRDLDPLLPAGVVLDDVRELSAKGEWLVYTTKPELGDGFDVHLAALDTLDVPVTIASFPDATSLDTALAPDHGTIYFEVGVGAQSLEHFAVDLTSDPPAPPVALHPPLQGQDLDALWAPDMSALVLFSGAGPLGDLHLVEVSGAKAGPMQLVNAGAPGHARHTAATIARFSPDAARLVYFSDHESAGSEQLYLIDRDAPGAAPQLLSGPLAPGDYVYDVRFLPDPGRLIYFTDLTIVSVEFGAPRTARTLNPPQVTSIINALHHNTDGSRIVYSGADAPMNHRLFFVDLAAPEPVSVALADFLPPDYPLWAGFSPAGHHFFVNLGLLGGPVAVLPLDPPADALILSEPGELGGFLRVVPPA